MAEDKAEQIELGVLFPRTDLGERSTTATNKAVFTAAAQPINPQLAADIEAEPNWRHNYPQHLRKLVASTLGHTADAITMAEHGLQALHDQFEFVTEESTFRIYDALNELDRFELHTAVVSGNGSGATQQVVIPHHGELLAGDVLLQKIADWEVRGIIEPSHGDALRRVQAHPEWLDLSDLYIVLLGAGAEMGPFEGLLAWGANVLAVDLDRPAVWEHLIAHARQSKGTLHIPLRVPYRDGMTDAELAHHAGCNLLTETPEIAQWLLAFEQPLTLGGYAYLDGQLHVQVAMAMDGIMTHVTAARPHTTLAFLPTPTDVFMIPSSAAKMAQTRFQERSLSKLWQEPLRTLSGHRFFEPNIEQLYRLADGRAAGITDNLVLQQGPNYALAKRLQQWRALVARSQGIPVSTNVAPSTRTRSVVKNLALAAAYGGADWFGVEVFEPETSNALMATMLVHDLRYDGSVANPETVLAHPLDLFTEGANHGGLWRVAFASRSVMEIAALLGWREVLSR